jgi:hypothetical protein
VPVPVPSTPVTATPHLTHGSGEVTTTKPGKGKHAHRAKHADHGKHLGWYKTSHSQHG